MYEFFGAETAPEKVSFDLYEESKKKGGDMGGSGTQGCSGGQTQENTYKEKTVKDNDFVLALQDSNSLHALLLHFVVQVV